MSIIEVYGFPSKFTLAAAVKLMAIPIHGVFSAINFKPVKGKSKSMKTCIFRLSEKLNPAQIVEQINDYSKRFKKSRYRAYIPKVAPIIPKGCKPKQLSGKIRQALAIPDDDPFEVTVRIAINEIMTELQAKYPGLFSMSKKTGHKLLEELVRKVSSRIKEIANRSKEISETGYKLTQAYRKAYPHFGDFQFLLTTLHEIQDVAKVPRMKLQENDITSIPPINKAVDLSQYQIKGLLSTYTKRIQTSLAEHIGSLHTDPHQLDSADDTARKQVREQLKKLAPYLDNIVTLVMRNHVTSPESPYCDPKQIPPVMATHRNHHEKPGPFYKIRVYGEPNLPDKQTMRSFLARFKPGNVVRSTRMYNLLKCCVPPKLYQGVIAMNGTVLNGSKLVICSSEMPTLQMAGLNLKALEGGEDVEEIKDDDVKEDDEFEMEM